MSIHAVFHQVESAGRARSNDGTLRCPRFQNHQPESFRMRRNDDRGGALKKTDQPPIAGRNPARERHAIFNTGPSRLLLQLLPILFVRARPNENQSRIWMPSRNFRKFLQDPPLIFHRIDAPEHKKVRKRAQLWKRVLGHWSAILSESRHWDPMRLHKDSLPRILLRQQRRFLFVAREDCISLRQHAPRSQWRAKNFSPPHPPLERFGQLILHLLRQIQSPA